MMAAQFTCGKHNKNRAGQFTIYDIRFTRKPAQIASIVNHIS